MDPSLDFPALLPHLPLRLVAPLHSRGRLHRGLPLHLQARLIRLHHGRNSAGFQAPLHHLHLG